MRHIDPHGLKIKVGHKRRYESNSFQEIRPNWRELMKEKQKLKHQIKLKNTKLVQRYSTGIMKIKKSELIA